MAGQTFAASHRDIIAGKATSQAAEVESGLAASLFRFGACRAHFILATGRNTGRLESRLPGLLTIEVAVARCFAPAPGPQRMVEGLWVAAIIDCKAGLVGYLARSTQTGGLRLEPDPIVGIIVPVLAGVGLHGFGARAGMPLNERK